MDTTDNIEPITDHITWFRENDGTPTAFFEYFGITRSEDGHRRYSRALSKADITDQEKTLLSEKFELWKKSESALYWERRNTKVVAKKSAWKTAGQLIKGSEPFVQAAITENAKEQKQSSASQHPPSTCTTPRTPRPATNTKSASKGPAKRTRTKTNNLPKKRMRLQDPWHDLAEIAVDLFKGKAVDLPPEATKDIEKNPERRKLYEMAWHHLTDAKVATQQRQVDKGTCLLFRDAFVALSGVFNLYSPATKKALSSADYLEVKKLCLVPELEFEDKEVKTLLDSLKTTKSRKLTDVLEDVYSWLSSKPTFRLFLLVLRNIIENILNPHHGDNKPLECDSLLIWGCILKDARPKGSPFTFSLGERASSATRESQIMLACALNTGCSARKCDCTLSVGKTQFGNGEAKRASGSRDAVKVQLRKNIKITRSVMLQLSKFGLDCPPQLSIYGLQADVFRVLPWKGVYVAAAACKPITLPTKEAAWNLFLDDSAYRLKNLLEYYHEYAVDAKEKMDAFEYNKKTVGQEEEEKEEGESGMDEEIELIRWDDVILHTPTMPRVGRTTTGNCKSANQNFQQRMQEIVSEPDDNEDDEYEDHGYEDDEYDDDDDGEI
ncbi:MAG: hypothetical protein J3Q66DRAFT_322068 [Benniella sp.]|nr:MAG: hypothetical protein J3Q66DRAFT_322068 [Benniella sp.]